MPPSNPNGPNDDAFGPTLQIDDRLLSEALAAVERRTAEGSAEKEAEEDEQLAIETLADELIISIEGAGTGLDRTASKGSGPGRTRPPKSPRARTKGSRRAPGRARPRRPASRGSDWEDRELTFPQTAPSVSGQQPDEGADELVTAMRVEIDQLKAELDQERRAGVLATSRIKLAERSCAEAESERDSLDRYSRSLRLRLAAQEEEMGKLQSRAAKEVRQARLYGAENLIREMLPVLDHLQLALNHATSEPGKLLDGVRMVATQFHRSLERVGITAIEGSPGTPFDPSKHEAILRVPSDEHPEGCIVEEYRAGYLLRGRLLRASQVSVCGKPVVLVRRAASKERAVPSQEDDALATAASSSEEE